MKILLINQNSVLNLGDFAIYLETLRLLEAAFPGAEITLSFHDTASAQRALPSYPIIPSLDAWAFQVDAAGTITFTPTLRRLLDVCALALAALCYRAGWRVPPPFRDAAKRQLVEAFAAADLVLACGGGYIYETQPPRGLLAQLVSLLPWTIFLLGGHLLALALGKPLVLLPQSIGPFQERIYRAIATWIVRRAKLTLVRERESLALLERLGASANACYAPDLAFGMPSAPVSAARELLAEAGLDPSSPGRRIGMTLLDWAAQSRAFAEQHDYERAIVGCIDALTAAGDWVVLFAQCHSAYEAWDDHQVNLRVRAQARQPERIVLFSPIVRPELLQAMYGQMDAFVGTRMHSVILATNAGVPVLAISYLHKSQGIMRELGLAERCFDIRSVTAKQLVDGLARLRAEPALAQGQAYVQRSQRIKRALQALLPMLAR